MRKSKGFTLIEILVALAIVAASLGVLLQLFASAMQRTDRMGELAHILLVKRMIVHDLERMNPVVTPTGHGTAEGVSYRWKSNMVLPFRSVVLSSGGERVVARAVALFSVAVFVDGVRGETVNFTLDKVGWRRIR